MEVLELFQKIKQEHQQFHGRFEAMVGSDPLSRREQLVKVNEYIYAHEQAEERTIYDAFKELDGEPRSMAQVRCEEHHVAQMLIREMADINLPDDIWVAKLEVLRFLYAHHTEKEENEMFDMAKDYFTDDEIMEMLKKYDRVEAQLFEKLEQPA